ncbi:MAG: hypothetical protein ABIG44_19305, partial [Planctomycetota bacterium]
NFMTDVGNYAIDVGVDQALSTCTANFNTWFNTPITNLYQDLWTSGVLYEYPVDPTFNTLLVN